MKELLIKLKACSDAREWAGDKTIEKVVEQCHRGDWLLWLSAKVDIGLQPLTLAKGHCANTIRHLMKDQRSIKAVDTAIAFGEGNATKEELDVAYAAATAATTATATTAYAAYAAAATAATAAAYAAGATAATAYFAAVDAADAFDTYAAADAAEEQNQKETADICRKYIGQLIINKCNELNTKEK